MQLERRGKGRSLDPNRISILYRRAYRSVVNRHRKRWAGSECITFNEFKVMADSPCTYCGHKGSNAFQDYGRGGMLLSDTVLRINGIDRICSDHGYTPVNTTPCCLYCNRGKNDRKLKYFLHWVAEVYHKSIKGTENDIKTLANLD